MKGSKTKLWLQTMAAFFMLASAGFAGSFDTALAHAQTQSGSRTFPETGHTVRGRFLEYWDANGGLMQQGYPISEEMQEVSPTDGRTYTVQYFERAVFEAHPENQAPYDVLLSLVGVFDYVNRYGSAGAPNQKASTDNPITFTKETGKTLGGKFRQYWETHGGLAQQGYPISDEFQEVSTLNGKVYTVQYFERAVFEFHPENAGTPYEVLLSQLGTISYTARYLNPEIAIRVLPEHVSRLSVAASEQYLVWEYGTGDLFGYDLQTGKQIPVSVGEPYAQEWADISGANVVYESRNDERYELPFDVVVKNLETGATRKFPTGTTAYAFPRIAGQRVAWSDGLKLALADLENGAIKEIASMQGGSNGSIQEVKISEEYVVWTELLSFDPRYDSPRPSYIKAYNIGMGTVKTILQFEAPSNGPRPEYAIDGHRLALNEPLQRASYRVVDLDTGATTPVPWEDRPTPNFVAPILKGDLLVWSAYDSEAHGLNIWGINLKAGGKPVPLVIGPGDQIAGGFAGDRLVWSSRALDVPYAGIGIAPVQSLFATAPERQESLDGGRQGP